MKTIAEVIGIEKKEVIPTATDPVNAAKSGYNVVFEIAQSYEMDVEKLARVIYDNEPKSIGTFSTFQECKSSYLKQAKAIINNHKEWIVKKA